jgi:cytoskeletal protein CcmA (bactofilin family)
LQKRVASTPELEADMDRPAEIGASIMIKGNVTAHEELVISGRVEGSITVEGFSVTVRPGAQLVADIDARAIVVGGQVVGTLSASESIELHATADVEGELSAAAMRLDAGAVFNGKAETTKPRANPNLQLAS